MGISKRFILLPFGAVAFLLALTAFAWACTTMGGTARITGVTHAAGASSSCPVKPAAGWDECAAPGDILTVTSDNQAHRLDGPGNVIQYYLYFLNYAAAEDDMGTCMAAGGESLGGAGQSAPMLIGGPSQADTSGTTPNRGVIAPTLGRVPSATPTGGAASTLGPARVCFMGSGSGGTGAVNDAKRAVLTRVSHQWGTFSDTLRVVAI